MQGQIAFKLLGQSWLMFHFMQKVLRAGRSWVSLDLVVWGMPEFGYDKLGYVL